MKLERKKLKFYTGVNLPFEVIKKNREQATYEMAEGNPGLYRLLNTCIDLDLPTLSCCGDVLPMIAFDYNEKTKKLLCSLWAHLESMHTYGGPNFNVRIGYNIISDRHLCVRIRKLEDSIDVFMMIDEFIRNPEYLEDYSFFEEIDAILERLSETYVNADIGDGHFFDDIHKYIIYTGEKYNVTDCTPKGLKTDSDYVTGRNLMHYFHYYGVDSEKEISELMYALYDSVHMKTKEFPRLECFVHKLEQVKDKR